MLKVNVDDVLFSVTLVTLAPMTALMVVSPLLEPELVIVPTGLIAVAPDSVMLPAPPALSIKSLPEPVLVTPPLNVILVAVVETVKS